MSTKLRKMNNKLAFFLVLVTLLNLFLPIPLAYAAEPDTIVAWNHTAVPDSSEVPATAGLLSEGATLTNFSEITPKYSTSSLSIGGWDNGADAKYWQLNLSTKGYENLSLEAITRSSGTGPRDFKVVYSIDNGSTWEDVPNGAYAITATSLKDNMGILSLPVGAADVSNLQVRFIMTSNISSRAGTKTYAVDETVAAGGTSNINNIVVKGTPVKNNVQVGTISASPDGGTVAVGSKVALSCESDGADIMYSINGGEFAKYDSDAQITLTELPATVEAYGTQEGLLDSKTTTWNFTQAQVGQVTANPNGGKIEKNSQVTLSSNTPNTTIMYSLDGGLNWQAYSEPISFSELPATIETYAKAEGMKDSESSTFNFTELSQGDYNLYFGQLHSHTTNSDGIGSLDDAYSHARDTAGLDFFAVTDHSNSFDNDLNSNMGDGSQSTKWANGLAAADRYNGANFVGMYGFEMTWSNGTGHINTFNTPGFETRNNQVYKNADGLQQYYNVLKEYPQSISQFNHPGDTFGDFNDFSHYDPIIDQRISLIEVGNGEGAVGSSSYFSSYEYYTRALDKGWHLSPTNNQDNHKGLWGDSNTARTAILADELTRDGVYDAMRDMRTYATEDNNLQIEYTLNGNEMGSILPEKPGTVDIKINLQDPDNEALGKVSVISNGGKVVASETIDTNEETVEFNLSPDYSYYYIRVDQEDKDIAVTAPVWIDEVDKAGISKTEASTTLPMEGDELTIATSLFNNENSPMDIVSLEYTIDGKVINKATSVDSVASLSTGEYSFTYTPDKVGKYDVNVKLTANINGVEKIFTDVLKLNVADPKTTSKVIIDGSHYNDYVNGYYSGNMTNFISLANSKGMDAYIEINKLTDDVLNDAQLLLLSAPAKKNGTANGVAYTPTPYTEDEIAAIKKFADNGGSIIVTSLADYQDNRNDTTNHSAYQQNQVLEAIGAGTRINDDEVVDYENNPNVPTPGVAGGTPYRIPMNAYNMNSTYLNGVDPSQDYSFYSGCSITMGDNATGLVKGTSTTYGFDSDNDSLGGAYVSAANKTIPEDTGIGKGNVVALAEETLPGGGKLFVGGTVFYSNFEIKVQLDNTSQLQNSNYNITSNILDSIKKTVPVTPIAQVRNAEKGETFTVEGTVTAGTKPGDNAFFDTIYIQDATGGINLFPVSGQDIEVGQKVKATGIVDEYQGDLELRVSEFSVTDTEIQIQEPSLMNAKDAMDSKNGGMLIKVEGTVTKMDSQNIYLDDGSGEARIFVDGYIGDGSGDESKLGKWDSEIQVGDKVSAIGLASVDPVGSRLRVRNTNEIVKLQEDPDPTEPVDPDPTEPVDPDPTEPVDPDPTEPVDPDPTEPVDPDPTDPVLDIQEVDSNDKATIQLIETALGNNFEKYKAFDVNLLQDGVRVQPNGTITIALDIPEDFDDSRVVAFRINEDGTKTKMDGKVVDGKYEFATDHLSLYVLAEAEEEETPKDNTDNSGNNTDTDNKDTDGKGTDKNDTDKSDTDGDDNTKGEEKNTTDKSPKTGDPSNILFYALVFVALAVLVFKMNKRENA